MSASQTTRVGTLLCQWGAVLCAATTARGGAEPRVWDARFFAPGINGEVRTLARAGNDLYAGGDFTGVGKVPATNIARWDGTNWTALGGGLNGPVNALAVRGSEVIAGGTFTQASGVSASLVVRWDGAAWSPLGSGVSGTRVEALAVDAAGMLYAAGELTNAGSVPVANIARWDGTNWSALGSGLSNDPYAAWVLALAVRGTDLFAGGFFSDAGGVNVSCIAKWNGSAWSALGAGVDDRDYLPQVTALAMRDNDLFVAGAFRTAGNGSAAHVAKWDGASWSALGDGLERFYGDVPVWALAVRGNELCVGGRFVSAGTGAANNLAVWNGTTWSELGGGVTGTVKTLAADGTRLTVGGSLVTSNGLNNVARWDAVRWSTPGADTGQGFTGDSVAAMVAGAEGAFVGGSFTYAGQTRAQNMASWDGDQWSALGSGVDGNVYALCRHGNELFVGGRFTSAGGLAATNIARWDGTDWSALGGGLNGTVYALACSDRELFAGGTFGAAGGVTASNIARWDGTNWSALGPGVGGSVRALAFGNGMLYVGGSFKSAGGLNATNLARWDGARWFALGGGVSGNVSSLPRIRPPPVSALALSGTDLYVGGDFALAGITPATNIARWNGTNWHSVGAGVTNAPGLYPPPTVASLRLHGGRLYAGGTFRQAGGTAAHNIARWDGTTWSALDTGIDGGTVLALAAAKDGLLVGGRFTSAGGKPAGNLSLWRLPPVLRIARRGDGVQLSWAAPADTGYVLEATDLLNSPVWRHVTNPPVASGGEVVIIESTSQRTSFYRLRRE